MRRWWDFPFDGEWVETGKHYFGTGAVGEISDFLGAPANLDPIPERLQPHASSCASFVLNVRHLTPAVRTVP